MEKRNEYKFFGKPVNLIIGLAIIAIFIVGLIKLTSFMYGLLKIFAPAMLIATAIIDHKVILNYVNWVINLFKSDTLKGVLAGVGTLFFFPVVFAFLLGKALVNKGYIKVGKVVNSPEQKNSSEPTNQDGEYINFEELEEETKKIKIDKKDQNI